MSGFINGNPYQTQSARGSFSSYTDGVIQGLSRADAASSNWLDSGVLTGTTTMWGGLPITEHVSPDPALTGSNPAVFAMSRGKSVAPATSVAAITGFSTFDQAHHGVITPGQGVPLFWPGMDLHFYRFGTNIRLPVKASASLLALGGSAVGAQVSWDFVTGTLQPYTEGADAVAVSGVTYTAASGTTPGFATVTTSAAHNLATGDVATISGMVPTGYNGSYPVTVTGADTFTYPLATNPGAATTEGVVNASGGILPVKVLEVYPSNCETVSYDPVSGNVSWNTNDAAALILI